MSTDNRERQLQIAERLQLLLLEEFEKRLLEGTISDTGMATCARLLMSNGWSIDPATLPKGLRDKLQKIGDPRELSREDVIPLFGT